MAAGMSLLGATEGKTPEKGQTGTLRVLLGLGIPAVVAIGIYSLTSGDGDILAMALLVATSAFAVGSLLGFLFGIPQYLAKQGGADPDKPSYQPNTNLTQVSDWLTKIIIGVGLVQFGQLVDSIGNLGDELAPSLGGEPAVSVQRVGKAPRELRAFRADLGALLRHTGHSCGDREGGLSEAI